MICNHCGTVLGTSETLCPQCGKAIAGQDTSRVCTMSLSRSLAARLTVYGTALLFLAAGILHAWSGNHAFTLLSVWRVVLMLFLAPLTCVATLVVHEGVHGLFFRIFGGRPRYGVGMIVWFLPYAYATSPGDAFTLLQMTVISLAPFFWISVATLLSMSIWPAFSVYAGIAFVVNFSGAVGDLWLVRQIWRFHGCRDARFVDENDALAVYSSHPTAQASAATFVASQGGTRVSRFMLRWLAATGAILFAVLPLTLILAVLGVRHLTIGPPQLVLYTFENLPQNGLSISYNLYNIAGTGLLFAALCLFFDRSKWSVRNNGSPEGPPHPVVV